MALCYFQHSQEFWIGFSGFALIRLRLGRACFDKERLDSRPTNDQELYVNTAHIAETGTALDGMKAISPASTENGSACAPFIWRSSRVPSRTMKASTSA